MHVFRVGALFNRRNKTKGIDQKAMAKLESDTRTQAVATALRQHIIS